MLTRKDRGNCFLTELHHGLDVINLETTATLKLDVRLTYSASRSGKVSLVVMSDSSTCLIIL